jgi:hypothetical protein
MDWAATIREQEASGQGVREFCQQRGLREGKFYSNRLRLSKQAVPAGKFARVETSKRVSLELEGGIVIRVEIQDLKAVLAALQ